MWFTIKLPDGKGYAEFLYAFRGSFLGINNGCGFNCFYLNKNNWKDMWLLDNLYGKSKEIKKYFSKFYDRWSMKC